MIRILLFIFAFNALLSPASAKSLCDMSVPINNEITQNSASLEGMSDHCSKAAIDTDEASPLCCTDQCASDCMSHSSVFSLQIISQITHQENISTLQQILSLRQYKIILPIDTPPPLV